MDRTEQSVGTVLEATDALLRISRAESNIIFSPISSSAASPVPKIRGEACDKVSCGHDFCVSKDDRIAISLPCFPGGIWFRSAILGGTIILTLGFGFFGEWFAQRYLHPLGDVRSTATRDALTDKQNTILAGSSENTENTKVRTVNQELPIEARALLDTIADSESAYPGGDPYKVLYGGRVAQSFTDHPRQYMQIVAGPNIGQKTSAAGRYQYLERSWNEASSALSLPDFSPASQDKAASWDAQRIYRAKTGRDLVTDIREADGDPKRLEDIGRGISGWWTSLPGGIEPNEATKSFGERFAQNLSYYKDLSRTVVGSDTKRGSKNIASLFEGPPAPNAAGTARSWQLPMSTDPGPTKEDILRTANLAASTRAELSSPVSARSMKQDKMVTGETSYPNENGRQMTTERIVRADGRANRFEITNPVPLPKTRSARITQEPKSAVGAMQSTLRVAVPETKAAGITGWVVSRGMGGKAILKSADKILVVKRGDVVPGVGRVADILRWGDRWIVATDKGLISTP
jgi:muramidase (phage lysozyme)